MDEIKKAARETGVTLRLKDGRVAYFKDIEMCNLSLKQKNLKYADLVEHETDQEE